MRLFLVTMILGMAMPSIGTAQDVTLRVHHFMTSQAPLHSHFLNDWGKSIEQASDGRIEVQLFDSTNWVHSFIGRNRQCKSHQQKKGVRNS